LAEWLVELGIGEERAIRIHQDRIVAARLHWPGSLTAGQVEDAVLTARFAGAARGMARFDSGEDALVDRLPRAASEGARLRLKVTRASVAEAGRTKPAQARPSEEMPRPAPSLAETLSEAGHAINIVHRFPPVGWDELVSEGFDRRLDFAGGSIHLSPTPAMTLIDVDGTLPPRDLALAAIPAIADAIRRFDLSGSIGIDFPTLATKADRRAVDERLTAALDDWSHEHTTINGFGFVQLVARLERPSILNRIAQNPAAAGARRLLRRAEGILDPGRLLLTAHPLVLTALQPAWREELSRRTGRGIELAEDRTLALEAGFAQAITP
jgi:hypothetical protein